MRTGRQALALAIFWIFCLTLALSQTADGTRLVDFRMAPLEQARKVHAVAGHARSGETTLTVMNLRPATTEGDYTHMIVDEALATPAYLPGQLQMFDGISWHSDDTQAASACDSTSACKAKTNDMCAAAGNGGVKAQSVKITVHSDGTKTCTGNCQTGTSVAFVTCGGGTSCVLCD